MWYDHWGCGQGVSQSVGVWGGGVGEATGVQRGVYACVRSACGVMLGCVLVTVVGQPMEEQAQGYVVAYGVQVCRCVFTHQM
jgi:hypothetical protein